MDKKNEKKLNKEENKTNEKEQKAENEEIEKEVEGKNEKKEEESVELYENLPKEELIEIIERIESELEETKKEKEKYKEVAINIKDKFDHFQRLVEKEKKELKKSTKEKVIRNFLNPFEQLTISLKYEDDPQFAKAIKMVYKEMKSAFEKSDLEFIFPEKGTAFDPFEHDVADKIETEEITEYHVHSVHKPGYKMDGKVIEPAKVNVAVKPKKVKEKPQKEEKSEEENKKEGDE
ncbi:nucleotide exchange factor GrpE [Geotoga petraea]|jgi:molecular chaperone GrpE|uniref:Protein GrpE n=1 Tax=Geotoga petraea TaxID=28234 RepID=A0A1G6NLD3_9BACT|nr:nucleotide exchange factor GrpE [Geotoga petraea]MDK2945960.1 molecular chaperone GrpE [Geotoga sp.]TGG87824.1 nucleotide exchange factor GrpE [Geotoga petraea]SDC68703.1 molecular chaperone GrpE [Geotoga petraea]